MQIALILSFAVGIFLSLVTVGCHVENTDGATFGNPIGAQGRDTGGKVVGHMAMEPRDGYSCLLAKALDSCKGARSQKCKGCSMMFQVT